MPLPERGLRAPAEILAIRADRLGELLLTLPAIRAIKDSYRNVRVTLMVHPNWESLVKRLTWIDQVVAYDGINSSGGVVEGMRLVRVFRSSPFDIAILFHSKKSFNLASFLAWIPTRIGYHRKWGILLTHSIPDEKFKGEKHELEYNMDLIRLLPGIRIPPKPKLIFPVTEEDRQKIRWRLEQTGVGENEPFIAIHPMTSDPRPWFAAKRFVSVANEIERAYHWRTIWVGGQEETNQVNPLMIQLGEPHLDFCGLLSLGELAALLEKSKLLVSMDSGPVHIAAAVGTPTVVLFGKGDNPGQPRRWGPWGNRHELLYHTSIAEREKGYSLEEIMGAIERCLMR